MNEYVNEMGIVSSIEKYYTVDVHRTVSSGRLCGSDIKKGIYFVVFRVLKKDSKQVVYKYVSYPDIFINILLLYLFTKIDFSKSAMFNQWGDYFTVVDSELNNEDIKDLFERPNGFNKHLEEYTYSKGIQYKDMVEKMDIIKKTTMYDSDMVNCISSIINKEYNKVFYNKYGNIDDKCLDNFYLVRDTVFVVKDLMVILESLKGLGYDISRGSKERDSLDSGSFLLSSLDSECRGFMYDMHISHNNENMFGVGARLSRSKFNFKNIHMNIGGIRHYSTINKKNNVNSRQGLFQHNYNIISEILESNYNVGSVEIQKKIEEVLYMQENIYSDLNEAKKRLNFSEKGFEVLELKYKDLHNLLSNTNNYIANENYNSTTVLPLVKEIVNTLGVQKVTEMLLSYFMEILTIENLGGEEENGLSTISGFYKFGKKIFNRFIFIKYMKSEIYKNNGSIGEYILTIENDYKLIYDDSESGYALIGGYLVCNLITVNLLVEKLDRNPNNHVQTIHNLRVVSSIRDIFIKDNLELFHIPQKLPMVCEPKPYKYSTDPKLNKLGGYLLNDIQYASPLIKKKIGSGKETVIQDKNMIVDIINNYMKTPYKINTDVLEFIDKYGIKKNIILDDNDELYKKFIKNPYTKLTKQKNKEFKSFMSKIFMQKNILSIAKLYSKVDKIYFPMFLDSRTRIYCRTDYFDFQKSDLCKGLIMFATPGKLNKHDKLCINYFKAYGANMYGHGMDKKSLTTRVKWIDENSNIILNFRNNDIVDRAEDKSCFIAFCFEYERFAKFSNNHEEILFNTYLPIQMDATCNGYQHLALLTKEKDLLGKLNLGEASFEDDPEDFYSFINEKVNDHLKDKFKELNVKLIKTNLQAKELEEVSVLLKVNFNRSIAKAVAMKYVYNATMPTLIDSIINHESITEQGWGKETYYIYNNNFDIELRQAHIIRYISYVKLIISMISPKIDRLGKYLDSVVEICTRLGMHIPWPLPHGAQINQSRLVEDERKVAAFSFTKSKYTFKRYTPGKYSLLKQKNSLRPNLIHSLDATTIALLYNSIPASVHLYTIHDCFAVTANNIPILIEKLKMAYIKLYSQDSYLNSFDELLRFTISTTYGENIFKVKDDFINLPNKNIMKTMEFPRVEDITNLSKNKLRKVDFPNINYITKSNIDISYIRKSKYPII